jgi:putative transposase
LLVGLNPQVPRLKKIWADGAYTGEKLAGWLEERGGWKLEIVERDRKAEEFEVLSKRWILERTFSWLIRNRRLLHFAVILTHAAPIGFLWVLVKNP